MLQRRARVTEEKETGRRRDRVAGESVFLQPALGWGSSAEWRRGHTSGRRRGRRAVRRHRPNRWAGTWQLGCAECRPQSRSCGRKQRTVSSSTRRSGQQGAGPHGLVRLEHAHLSPAPSGQMQRLMSQRVVAVVHAGSVRGVAQLSVSFWWSQALRHARVHTQRPAGKPQQLPIVERTLAAVEQSNAHR